MGVQRNRVQLSESVREMQEDGYGRPPAIAARVLVTMEADVSLLREHLRQVEELHPQD
jgi:hypothetical protein